MRWINGLEVDGESLEITELTRRADARPDDQWRREREPAERLRKMLKAPVALPETTFCFSIGDGDGSPGATVWLERKGPEKLVVSHIVPAGPRALSDQEYNTLLKKFDSSVLEPLIQGDAARTQRLNVKSRFVLPKETWEDSISPDAMDFLRSFSVEAKQSRFKHLDWQTWDRFLIQIHVNESVPGAADLEWWLEQESWPEDWRHELVDSYKKSLSLLAKYDQERVPT